MNKGSDYVSGERGRYDICVPIQHPPHCVCALCQRHRKTPAEWEAPFVIRARRRSPSPYSRSQSSAYAFDLKEEMEKKLFDAVGATPPPPTIAHIQQKPERDSFVYLIGCEASAMFKIGVTVNVRKRFFTLQSHSPTRLRVVAIRKGSAREEAEAHQRYAEYRRHGEWFALPSEVVSFLVRLSDAFEPHGIDADGRPKERP